MKPSYRMFEIYKEIDKDPVYKKVGELNKHTIVIGRYLDEEKDRVNGILHEIVSAMYDGSFDTQNCNYLHQMIDEKLSDSSAKESE